MFRSCQINLLLSDSQMSWYYLIWYLLYSGAFDSFYHISKNPSFHRIRHYSRDRWGDVWERIHDASPQASSYSFRTSSSSTDLKKNHSLPGHYWEACIQTETLGNCHLNEWVVPAHLWNFWNILHISFFKKRFYLLIFRQRVREGERGKHWYVRDTSMVASRTPPAGDPACNPGMCLDWELNWRPLSLQAGTQSTEPHSQGTFLYLLIKSLQNGF